MSSFRNLYNIDILFAKTNAVIVIIKKYSEISLFIYKYSNARNILLNISTIGYTAKSAMKNCKSSLLINLLIIIQKAPIALAYKTILEVIPIFLLSSIQVPPSSDGIKF